MSGLEPTPSAKRHPRPSVKPRVHNRVATPLPAPSYRPSLIPADVLRDMESVKPFEQSTEPHTAPNAADLDVAFMTEIAADRAVVQYALRQVALFKSVSAKSLDTLVEGATQVNVPAGEMLFMEGDEATSFFIVLDGTFEMLRREGNREMALRHEGVGSALGLFGLFTAQLRSASARAIGECTVIQVRGEKVQHLLELDTELHDKMLKFFRERIVETFLTSQIFGDIDSIARARLIGRFTSRSLETGAALVSPGEVTNLIAVVTHGVLTVEERSKIGGAAKHFEVTPGQFVAVTSALSGQPTRMKIFASEFASVELLSHKDLLDLMKDYTSLRALPSRLLQNARQLDRDLFCGSTGVPGL